MWFGCAAKFEEQPSNVPTLSELASQLDEAASMRPAWKARLIQAEKLVRTLIECKLAGLCLDA
jgi:hypothetical protein